MKKIVALALTVVMVLGLLAGCGEKPMDAKTLAQKMDEAMKTVTAMKAGMEMDLDLTMAVTGMTLDIGMNLDMDYISKLDMSSGYANIKMGIEVMGQNEEMEMEAYYTVEGDKLTTYTYEPTMEQWVKAEIDASEYAQMQEQLTGITMKYSEIPAEQLSLAPEKETVDGKECYVLTVNLDGAYLNDSMATVMESLGGEELAEEEKEMLQQMDWSAIALKMVYHVDAATFMPVKMVGELAGLGDMMNGMMSQVLAEQMLGGEMDGMDISFEIPTITIVMDSLAYNDAVEVPAIPQEAIDNAVTEEELMEDVGIDGEELGNPPQADGSYLMSQEHDQVAVTIPEGYMVFMAEQDCLVAMTEDMMMSVSYMLLPGYTDEILRAELNMNVDMLKEMEMYAYHGEGEKIGAYSVMDLGYSDGTMECYAWTAINDGLLVITVSGYGTLPDMEAVLNGIVIAE